jgi:hypothetical protein
MARASSFWLSALALAVALPAHGQTPSPIPGQPFLFVPPDVDTVNGAIGVCVRWSGADRSHVSDVVIVESSGDAKIDAEAPAMIRSIPWPIPEGYRGEWEGLSLSFTAAPPRATEPDCETLMKAPDPAI